MKMMKKLFALLLVLCMAFSLCACGGNSDTNEDEQNDNKVNSEVNDDDSEDASSDESEEDDEEQTQASFKVKVVDQNGNPVVSCIVQICKDSCMPQVTNAEGIATFNVEIEEGHYLSISKCPEGYEYTGEEKIYLEAGATEYTLEMTAAQ